jgi:hypothetical protein
LNSLPEIAKGFSLRATNPIPPDFNSILTLYFIVCSPD